ncbi:methyltransferase domain-containing protein [Agromyces sp. MMS17-SY077]|uniref:Methyltransferase domain-containing protein n=1 Tax=Agromyces seonyuensis TaxID=2662446 RepID=A0A6I4NXY6_9MICO|nr:class I SAM-dependent methyltransferase [Agromyces seonyuensis]MWB99230.1 methyltransferase domain-containing protein [Agromyces seonyuensis]
MAPRALLRWSVVEPSIRAISPERVVEFGCGQGAFGARVAVGRDYLGVEPDPRSAGRAAAAIEPAGGRVVNGFPSEVDLGDPADLVCAFEVLEHIEDDAAALDEWITAVRPGGRVMISVPAYADRFGPSDVRSGHFRRYDPDHLRRLFERAGLVDVDVVVYAWPLGYLLEAVRNRRDRRFLDENPSDIEELTAASGRTGQPGSRWLGLAIRIGTAPFVLLQALNRRTGTGLVAVGTRPVAE